MSTAHPERERVADFWDDVLRRWLAGDNHLVEPLPRWIKSYDGKGKGAVDLAHYPDPYVGDLRGIRAEPRVVVLGLNPGVGYTPLQGPSGLWAERIREVGYSRCFVRSPAEDLETWIRHHKTASRFWANLVRFARRWLDTPDAGVTDILNFELYPWHSYAITAPMRPPADLIDDFIWKPVQEIDTPAVFAFGAPWFEVMEELGLPRIAMFGQGAEPFPEPVAGGWKLGLFRLPSGQVVAVSSQSGYAGPPGPQRLEIMRRLVVEATG